VQKGEHTRQMILDRASSLASRIGLEGLSIGKLAEELELSKSGLSPTFAPGSAPDSSPGARRGTLRRGGDQAGPRRPRGEKRVRAIFERWIEWPPPRRDGGRLLLRSRLRRAR